MSFNPDCTQRKWKCQLKPIIQEFGTIASSKPILLTYKASGYPRQAGLDSEAQ